jgi:hypothetical protein
MKYSKIIIVATLLLFQLGAAQENADVVLNKAFTEAKAGRKMFYWCSMLHGASGAK